jgi:hypothetical protein
MSTDKPFFIMETIKEIWRDIPNFEGYYQVSNLGRVKSLERKIKDALNRYRVCKERIKAQAIDTNGYKIVCLCKNGKQKIYKIHKLVAMAFLNHIPCGHKEVVDHIDNDKMNNNLSNLQLTTMRHNSSKDRINGTSKYTGVYWGKKRKKWVAKIKIDGVNIFLGRFENELEAHEAYQNALNNLKQ